MLLNSINEFLKLALILILLSGISACKGEDQKKQSSPSQNQAITEEKAPHKAGPELANSLIKVRYFYSDSHRCASCRKIETYTKKAVMGNFADELKSGKMEFSLVDMDNEENKPLAKQYKLFTKSVILSQHSGDSETRWSNLDKVWTLLNSEEAFASYIVKEIKGYLGN